MLIPVFIPFHLHSLLTDLLYYRSSTVAIVLVLIVGIALVTNLHSTANDTASNGIQTRTTDNLLILAQEVTSIATSLPLPWLGSHFA
jgi:hypothetical protein